LLVLNSLPHYSETLAILAIPASAPGIVCVSVRSHKNREASDGETQGLFDPPTL